MAALGLAAGISLSLRTATAAGVSPDGLWDAGLFAVFAAFLSSRLLLVLLNLRSFVSAPILLLTVPSLTAAGLALTAVAVLVYLRRRAMPVLRVLDAWAAPAALVWAFLAMGHLAEGSDPGLPSAWGLRTSLAGYREQPVALYAAVLALLLTTGLLEALRRGRAAGQVAGAGLVGVGVVQFALTFLRIPYQYEPGSQLTMLDPMQWAALGMVIAGWLLSLVAGRGTEGISPRQSSASGRNDEEVGGPGDGDGRGDGAGGRIRREHSMHAHQVSAEQGRREDVRERES